MFRIRSIKPFLRSIRRRNFNDSKGTNEFNYEIVNPQSYQLIKRSFPSDIQLPTYAENGLNDDHLFENKILEYKDLSRSDEVIQGVKDACKIAKQLLDKIGKFVKPGMTGEQIDEYVFEQCLLHKCYPSPLNYNEYPKCVTLSVNNIAIHSIPDQRKLIPSDILKVDVSVFFRNYHGDTASTYLIGKNRAINIKELSSDLVDSNVIDRRGLELIKTAKKCLDNAIGVCKAGVHLNEIGSIVEQTAKDNGFDVIPAVCGHSIGEYLHGLPHIVFCPYDEYTEDDILLDNMLVTIEPVICEGKPDVFLLEDGWTVCTEDNLRTAQFEHTILVKKTHSEILT